MKQKMKRFNVKIFYLSIMTFYIFSQFYCMDSLKSRSNPFDQGGEGYILTGNDTTVSIGDSLKLHVGKITAFNGENIQIEWNINNTGFRRVNFKDTVIIVPSIVTENYACVIKASISGQFYIKLDTLNVNVILDPPIPTISTTTPIVQRNSSIQLKGTATDKFGYISKMEWKFDSSNWVETYSGDTTITAPSRIGSYICSLCVTDDDGVSAYDRVLITVEGIVDIDDNIYHPVKIGDQIWTIENLRVTKLNDSTPIRHCESQGDWYGVTTIAAMAYCYYNNDSAANAEEYGVLYNWYAVRTSKLAPTGWHIPTNADWDILQNYLIANGYNWDGATTGNGTGKSLAAKTDWETSDNMGAVGNDLTKNNKSGFSALPGGYRSDHFNGGFGYMGYEGRWWSANSQDTRFAYYYYLANNNGAFIRGATYLGTGLSVRLVQD
jgi:uncharacterized protein (TIGR02145 family)